VGIGAAPAEGVLRGLAEATGGACEFVAATEDAEAAIMRMFARIRAPRFATAEIRWPAKPTWQVPLPSGLFAGETIHAMARFDRALEGEATIVLHADKVTPALTSTCAFGAVVDDTRTLARMAASRHLSQVDAEAQLALALEYRLLTDRTNLIVVHERAAGEKAVDLPILASVAQMHAAGWGGLGTVHADMVVCRSAMPKFSAVDSMSFDMLDEPAPPSLRRAASRAVQSPPMHGWIRGFVQRWTAVGSPRIADLAPAGVPDAILDELRALVADGTSEADVVATFLETIADHLDAAGWDRRQLRPLRHAAAAGRTRATLRATMQSRMADWTYGLPVGG